MINWKVVVGSGIVAGVLSLLTGIISGVSFGTLFLRALMWGAIFCGVGGGVSLLISKYLPELLSVSKEDRKEDPDTRNNVDIVLPDENPHRNDEDSEEDSGEFLYESDLPDGQHESEGTVAHDNSDEGAHRSHDIGLLEEVEEMPGERGSRGRWRGRGLDDLQDYDGSEDLPDFGADAGDFDSSIEAGSFDRARDSGGPGISRRGSTIDILGHQADSEEVAKAIRTALKKDQKG